MRSDLSHTGRGDGRLRLDRPEQPAQGARVKIGVPLLVLALLVYPFALNDPFYQDIGVAVLLAAISASAWNIVGGYAGQVSVGHGMFFGIGAYVPLLVYQHGAWPPVLGVPIAIALSVLLAIAIGYPTFRL